MNIRWRSGDDDQPLTVTSRRRGPAVDPRAGDPRFHYFDLTGAHMPNLVDFASAFPDNTTDEIIGDKNLLRLELVLMLLLLLLLLLLLRGVWLGRGGLVAHIEIRISRDIGGWHPGGPTCVTRRPIARMRKRRHTFVCFDENVPDVVGRNVYGVCNTRDTQDPLQNREISTRNLKNGESTTSVEPGSIPSLAFNRAPLASWISLIFEPPFPITEPMRELGIMNLIVTARLPGTDGLSKGSSFIRRTMRPNA